MKKVLLIVAALALVGRVFAAHIPAPTGYVNDFAGVLHTEEKESLENDLASYKESTGNEIAVALIKSLDGDTVEDVAAPKPFPIPFSILILLFIYLCAFMARSKSVWLGGVAGGISGAGLGWWLGSVAAGAALVVFLALIGVLLDAILSRNFEVLKARGGKTGFFGSRGGFWTSSGGSKSSGSFGRLPAGRQGFSGGSSGGGGASSSW